MGLFYHRTTEERWKAIQKEGVLWGIGSGWNSWKQRNKLKNINTYRYTYLSPDDWGESYGTVLLAVKYRPLKKDFGKKHNYGFDPPPGQYCTQFSVFEPISLKNVKRVNI